MRKTKEEDKEEGREGLTYEREGKGRIREGERKRGRETREEVYI